MSSESTEPALITLEAGSRRVQIIVVWATLLVAASAFVVGVPALVWAGQEAGLGPVSWLVPLVVDMGLTVAGLAAAVRHSQLRRAALETSMMLGLVGLSMAVQALHAIELAAPVVAVLVVAAAPLTVLAGTHATFRAVLAEPTGRGRKKSTGRPAAATAARPSAPPTAATAKEPAATAVRPAKTAATRGRSIQAPVPSPVATSSAAELAMDDAVRRVLAGEMSQRQAAVAAGVSRHVIAAAVTAAA